MPKGIYKRKDNFRQIISDAKKGSIPWNKGKKFPDFVPWNKGLKDFMLGNKNAKGYKHTEEHKQKMSELLSGENNPNWNGGKRRCIDCNKQLSSRSLKVNRCIKCAAKLRAGENNCNWKGGVTKLAEQIRKCFKYRQWRSDIFERDNYTCQECGIRGTFLEAHHIKEFSKIMAENNIKTLEQALACEELWNINNGQTLCKECHKKTDNYLKNICKH